LPISGKTSNPANAELHEPMRLQEFFFSGRAPDGYRQTGVGLFR
jgi:hypothetical protein